VNGMTPIGGTPTDEEICALEDELREEFGPSSLPSAAEPR